MRRVITFLLVLSLTVAFLAVPASATSTEPEYGWVECLDYGNINDSSSNTVSIAVGTTYFNAPLPAGMLLNYVEIFFWCGGPVTISAGRSDHGYTDLELYSLGDNMYRAYGTIDMLTYSQVDFKVVSSYQVYLNVYSVRCQYVKTEMTYDSFFWQVSFDGSTQSGSYSGSGLYTVSDTVTSGMATFSADIWISNWERYDYFDITLRMYLYEINSITCSSDYVQVPVTYSLINTGSSYGDYYMVTIRFDFRGIDRNSSSPRLSIYGSCVGDVENYVTFLQGAGIVNIRYYDPVLYWMQKICGINQDMLTELDGIGNAVEAMAGVVGNIYVQLLNNIAPGVSNIYTVLSDYLPEISTGVLNIGTILNDGFDSLSLKLERVWLGIDQTGQKIIESIATWGQNIVDVLTPDTSASDEVGDDMASQATEIDKMNEQLDAVSKPAADDINADISSIVSGDDIILATSGLTILLGNEILAPVFTLSLIFILAAYVLYGKR